MQLAGNRAEDILLHPDHFARKLPALRGDSFELAEHATVVLHGESPHTEDNQGHPPHEQ
ncbi:MAG: hypothetical protein U5J83_06550 [Bryobacterales bacterium]|nr:hypothetical protein [Bryobacterales bacterium]